MMILMMILMMIRLVRALADEGLVVSFAEARRLIGQNCVKVNNMIVTDLDASVEPGDCVQIKNRVAIRIGEESVSKTDAP